MSSKRVKQAAVSSMSVGATGESSPLVADASATIIPISSPHDPHVYRHITLANGLSALLIVDAPKNATERARDEARKKKASKAASTNGGSGGNDGVEDESKPAVVSLSVRVGHWSDPKAVPGLAHFCEHMLFMGNATYPDENEWEVYLSDHGGASNAFTDAEHTCYYFEINPSSLYPALQRFAQFFVSPLFASSATKREIRAVDSEFKDCLNDDSERMSELIVATAAEVNPNHPFGKWGWGNLESLETNLKPKKDSTTAGASSSTTKKGKGGNKAGHTCHNHPQPTVDLRAELKSFHARYYSAHAMKLVVYQSGGKLDKLERWVRNEFEAIPNNGLPLNDFSKAGHPFVAPKEKEEEKKTNSVTTSSSSSSPSSSPSTCLKHIYYVVPIKEIYKLNVSWVLTPSFQTEYAKKPIHYAEHLLGHESDGSLYALLRSKGWITSLVAGVNESGSYRNTSFECMQLGVSMTREGCQHVNDILDYMFQYLSLIRQTSNLQPSIYEELKQLSEIGFLFSEMTDPSDMVQDSCINMHLYPPEDVIRGDYLHTEFDRTMTLSVLERLSVENCRIDLATPENKHRGGLKKAPWFHTEYTSEPIASELITRWSRYDSQPELIDPSLHLPNSNPFVPTDFEIRQHVSDSDAQSQHSNHGPILLQSTPRGEYWWSLDDTFHLPRGHIHILLETMKVYETSKNVAMSELLIKLWVDSMNEYAYQASLAELEFSIESLRSGFEFKFSGFHHKLMPFVETIVGGLLKLEEFLTVNHEDGLKRFESMKEKTIRHFKHLYFIPLKQANHGRLQLLQQEKYHPEEITKQCREITLQDMLQHIRSVICHVRLIGLVDGNISKLEASNMFEKIESAFQTAAAATMATATTMVDTSITPSSTRRIEHSICLPLGHTIYIEQRARNLRESNHAIEVYFQIGRATIFLRAILNLLESIIAEPAFDQLRTKEQLGYKVQSGIRNTHGILGFVICIQSASYEPSHLSQRIDDFLNDTFYRLLLSMSFEKFETQRSSLVAEHLYEDTHLGERIDRQWEEVTEQRSYCFRRPQIMAEKVGTITHEQVIQMYEHYFLGIRAEPPKEEATMINDDANSATPLASSPSPSPSPDAIEPIVAAAVSSIQLDPAQIDAKRKEDRKAAKKARTASARAAKSANSTDAARLEPIQEAAIMSKVTAARSEPIRFRRQLIVSIYGHAQEKKRKSSTNDEEDEDADDAEDGDDDDEEDEDADMVDEDDGEDDEEDEESEGEGEGEGGDGDDAGEQADGADVADAPNDVDDDVDDTNVIDSLWFTPSEWSERLEEQQRKMIENANSSVTQPPTKKQKNGRNKNTPKHVTTTQTSAATLASASPAATVNLSNVPPPASVAVNIQDGVSVNCACAGASSVGGVHSNSSSSSPHLPHVIRIRTLSGLESAKSSIPFMDDCNGPEPDLPIKARAKV